MKIGVITDVIREDSTGIGKYSKYLIEALVKKYKGSEFYFIDYEKNDFNRKNLILIENHSKRFFKTIVWHNILPRKVAKVKFDYILNLIGCPHFYSYKQREIIFVYDLSILLFPHTHPLSGVIYNRILFKKTVENCHKIITISENSKRELMDNYNISDKKIEIIFPTIPKPLKRENKFERPINGRYILYIGTIETRKNITSLLKAFYQLKRDNNYSHKLVIGGKKGIGCSDIFKLTKELKLEKMVVFTGYVTEKEKRCLYHHADLFVYPSLYEGFGMPPLEAMSYGCPVITSNTSSLPEVVGEAGIKIDPYDVNSLYLAMKKVLDKKTLRKQMIKIGYQQVKKFFSPSNLDKLFT